MTENFWAICLALPHEKAGVRDLFSVGAKTTYHGAVFEEGRCGETPAVLVQTGVGPRAAARSAEFLFRQFPVTHLLISGYCGALIPDFNTGHALLADPVQTSDAAGKNFAADAGLVLRSQQALREAGVTFRQGALVTSPVPVLKPADKKDLGERERALAVDMESSAILEACVQSGKKIASVTVRFIVDELADDWGDTQSFIDENAQVKPLQLVRTLIKKPKLVLELPGLEQKASRGRKSMAGFLKTFFSFPEGK